MSDVRVLAILGAGVLAACAGPYDVPPADASLGDDAAFITSGWTQPAIVMPSDTMPTARGTPAPAIEPPARTSPSGAPLCPMAVPPGDCDRCPERPCRQVRVPEPGESVPRWAMFCEQGDVREEARIACLCAGGDARSCEMASGETAVALAMIDILFGGEVPPAGTRYRDQNGLRAVVDQDTHDLLRAVSSPATVMRCEEPDPVAATERYEQMAQRVRMTGSCELP